MEEDILPSVSFIHSGFRTLASSAKRFFSCFGFVKRPYRGFSDFELERIFDSYSSGGIMKPTEFRRFLADVQREPNVSEDDAVAIMANYGDPHYFNNQNLLNYLLDPLCNYAIRNEIHDDMNQPLYDYFIFSGHNSYLSGNQIVGSANVNALSDSLRKGVRVVELDLWPSCGEKIRVKHGKTFVYPVDFRKCLETIRDDAFKVSHYPVVVILEDHLTPSLRDSAAKLIKEILGEFLYYPNRSEMQRTYPSPEALKKKILISSKLQSRVHYPGDVKYLEKQRNMRNSAVLSSSVEEDLLDSIIAIPGSTVKGKSVIDALELGKTGTRMSLSEPEFSMIVKSHPSRVIQFTQKNFLRIYPICMRIDSSNYNPIKAWSDGAQMAAVNMQGYGKHLWVTQGFFRANGSCGYVKKPDAKTSLDIFKGGNKPLPVKPTLKVTLCMGCGWQEHQRCGRRKFKLFSPPVFYARVGIQGVKDDYYTMKKTRAAHNNWEPIWNEDFTFTIKLPELALLRIEVYNHDKTTLDRFAGQICFPINELKSGYRVALLCDKNGDEWKNVKILLHIGITDFM